MTTELRMTVNRISEIDADLVKFCTRLEQAEDELCGRIAELGADPSELAETEAELRRLILRLSNDITRLECSATGKPEVT